MGLDADNKLSLDTHLSPQRTGSSGIVPRRGMLYSDASFSAPPLEKSAQCSCGYTTDIMSGKAGSLGWDCVCFCPLEDNQSHSQVRPPSSLIPRSCQKVERGSAWCSEWHSRCMGELLQKECCNCIRHLGLEYSDSLDCCKAWVTKAWEGCEVSRDSWEQAVRQVFFFYIQFCSNCDCLCHV